MWFLCSGFQQCSKGLLPVSYCAAYIMHEGVRYKQFNQSFKISCVCVLTIWLNHLVLIQTI